MKWGHIPRGLKILLESMKVTGSLRNTHTCFSDKAMIKNIEFWGKDKSQGQGSQPGHSLPMGSGCKSVTLVTWRGRWWERAVGFSRNDLPETELS